MAKLPEYYTTLSEAAKNAINALDQDKILVAKMLLKQGLFRAEELYLQETGGRPTLEERVRMAEASGEKPETEE